MMKLPSGSNLNKIEALAQQVGNGGSNSGGTGFTQVSAIAGYTSGAETEAVSLNLSDYAVPGTVINLDIACTVDKLSLNWGGGNAPTPEPLFNYQGRTEFCPFELLQSMVGAGAFVVGSALFKFIGAIDMPAMNSMDAQHYAGAWMCIGGAYIVTSVQSSTSGSTTPVVS